MIYATFNNEFIAPAPGLHAACPLCHGDVIAKCGQINVWHWAHKIKDCDLWSEPETPWHLGWKSLFPRNQTEVVMENHRADAVNQNGVVIEFQHSPISIEAVQEREAFYGDKMMWVLDGSAFAKNITLQIGGDFQWSHMRRVWRHSKRPIWIDLGTNKKTMLLDGWPARLPPSDMFLIKKWLGNPVKQILLFTRNKDEPYEMYEGETWDDWNRRIYNDRHHADAVPSIRSGKITVHGQFVPFTKQRFIERYIP